MSEADGGIVVPALQESLEMNEAGPVEVPETLPASPLPAVPAPAHARSKLDTKGVTAKRPRSLLSAATTATETACTASIESSDGEQLEEKACVICLDQPRRIVFNCSHCVACGECADKFTRCPLCRSPITERHIVTAETRHAVGFASCMTQWQQLEPIARVEETPVATNSSAYNRPPAPLLPADVRDGPMSPEPGVVHIIIALDRSGSMAGRRQAMLDSVNAFIGQQKQLQRDNPSLQSARITVLLFDRRPSFIIVAKPLMECRELTLEDYAVHSGTALYDSLMVLFRKFRYCENAIVAIITDGEDTCSRAFNRNQVASAIAMIRHKLRWHFHYLCVDMESAAQGRALGFDTTTEVRPGRLAAGVSHNLSSAVAASRASMSRISPS